MIAMRSRVTLLAVVLLTTISLSAQDFHHHMTADEIAAQLQMLGKHDPVTDAAVAPTGVTRSFNIIAKQFSFTVSPTPFTVNVGDTVNLTISVPSNDGSSAHGFLMDTYVPEIVINRGATKTATFVATTKGPFGFICTVSSCGSGHSSMFGTMNVNAAAAPTLTSFSPIAGSTLGGTSVTITGTNFVSGATVSFGTVAATSVTFNSATSLTAIAPPQGAGVVSVKVTNPDGQSATRDGFTYSVPAPAISSVDPATGPTSGGTTLTIIGSGFQPGATVTIGGVSASSVTFVSSTALTAVTPLGPINEQATQPKDVTVKNPDGVTVTKSGAFIYTIPALRVISFSPPVALPAGGTVITINGEGFTAGVSTNVSFGGTAATSLTVLNPLQMVVTAPAHAAGTVSVQITVGTNNLIVPNAVTYQNPPPRRRAAKQ